MSSIAERIKRKLEALEKYNFDEQAIEDPNYTDSSRDSDCEIELLNLENLELNSSLEQKEKNAIFLDSMNNEKQQLFEAQKPKLEEHYFKYMNNKNSNDHKNENTLK